MTCDHRWMFIEHFTTFDSYVCVRCDKRKHEPKEHDPRDEPDYYLDQMYEDRFAIEDDYES